MNVNSSRNLTHRSRRLSGSFLARVGAALLISLSGLVLSSCKEAKSLVEKPADPLAYSKVEGGDQMKVSFHYTIVTRKDDTVEVQVCMNVHNNTGADIDVAKTDIFKLRTGDGREIPYYIQPLLSETYVVPNGKSGYGHVRFRPTLADFQGPFFLIFPSGQKMVKDRNPVGDDDLPSSFGRSGGRTFNAVDWSDGRNVEVRKATIE